MNKRWNLMRGALAALVCLAMVLVWVPGTALAAEDTINIWVIYSTINSNGTREDFIKELKTIFEDTIKNYKGQQLQVYSSTNEDELNTISADNTKLLIILTPDPNGQLETYAPQLRTYMENGGCLWLCGENDKNFHSNNQKIQALSEELGVAYTLGSLSTSNIEAALDPTSSLGKPNEFGKYDFVMLYAANEIKDYNANSKPIITVNGLVYMIDTPVEKGFLTVSADLNLFYARNENLPWGKQILYNFLDRSIQSIQEASHSHKWTYSAEGFIISAYCTETEKAELCIYHGEQNAVKIETATKDKIYDGKPYDGMIQSDEFQTVQTLPKVINTYYKVGDNTPLQSEPIDLGNYKVVVTVTSDDGTPYSIESTFSITPPAPTVTAHDYTGVYDGQPHSITVTAPAGTNVTYSTDGINYSAANPAYTNAGTYTVYYKVDGTEGTAAVRIIPRTVSIRWSEETAFRYTGEPQAPTAGAEGLLPGDACEVEVSGAQTEPGEYTAEAVRLSNPNYRLPTSGTTQEFRIIRASTSAPSTPSYPIIVRDEAPEGGLVRASRDWSHRGATITVTAEPLEGFRLEQVTAVTRGGKSLRLTEKEGSGCKYTFTMPADKVFVEAVFSREETASTAGTGGEDAPAEPEIHAVSESPAVPEGTALTCPGVTACPIWPYFDANPSAWYHDGVHYCLETGLMTGYDDATFRPRDTVSRAEALVMLWRLRGSPAADSAPAFMDVSETVWYAGAVRWAASESIVLGTGTGRLAPGETLTHRQLNTILQRCAQSMGLEPPALMGEDPAALVSRAQAAVALADFAQNTLK